MSTQVHSYKKEDTMARRTWLHSYTVTWLQSEKTYPDSVHGYMVTWLHPPPSLFSILEPRTPCELAVRLAALENCSQAVTHILYGCQFHGAKQHAVRWLFARVVRSPSC